MFRRFAGFAAILVVAASAPPVRGETPLAELTTTHVRARLTEVFNGPTTKQTVVDVLNEPNVNFTTAPNWVEYSFKAGKAKFVWLYTAPNPLTPEEMAKVQHALRRVLLDVLILHKDVAGNTLVSIADGEVLKAEKHLIELVYGGSNAKSLTPYGGAYYARTWYVSPWYAAAWYAPGWFAGAWYPPAYYVPGWYVPAWYPPAYYVSGWYAPAWYPPAYYVPGWYVPAWYPPTYNGPGKYVPALYPPPYYGWSATSVDPRAVMAPSGSKAYSLAAQASLNGMTLPPSPVVPTTTPAPVVVREVFSVTAKPFAATQPSNDRIVSREELLKGKSAADWAALYDAGYRAYWAGKYAQAAECCAAAAVLDEDPRAWYYLSLSLKSLGNAKAAREAALYAAARVMIDPQYTRDVNQALSAVQGPSRDALTWIQVEVAREDVARGVLAARPKLIEGSASGNGADVASTR